MPMSELSKLLQKLSRISAIRFVKQKNASASACSANMTRVIHSSIWKSRRTSPLSSCIGGKQIINRSHYFIHALHIADAGIELAPNEQYSLECNVVNVALTLIARTCQGVCWAQEIECVRVVVWLLKKVQIRKCTPHIFLDVSDHFIVFEVRVPLTVVFAREWLNDTCQTRTWTEWSELTYVIIDLLGLGDCRGRVVLARIDDEFYFELLIELSVLLQVTRPQRLFEWQVIEQHLSIVWGVFETMDQIPSNIARVNCPLVCL